MTGQPYDPPAETKSGTAGWVWGVGGALLGCAIGVVIVVPLVVIVIIAGLTLLGTALNDKFETVGNTVQPGGGGSSLSLSAVERAVER